MNRQRKIRRNIILEYVLYGMLIVLMIGFIAIVVFV